ncbi:ROK family protein [Nonomuraea sp. CA-141351]|uniref:ROK family protein n=1 Tax=Nonomuraea sp. CA-141351 TaxID=3239996 RepID=UPI003D9355FF
MILAIDVGGTKMAAGLVARDGTVTRSVRVATPQGADASTLWKTLVDLVEPLSEVVEGGVEGVGVGCGGPMTWPDGEVSPLNIPGWRGFPLRARLSARFPGVPVRLHNDAVCLAVAEHWKGAGRGAADMLGMVVSTGVGGGLILNGRLVNGRTGNAGHIGHVIVEPDGGPLCGCGGHGCLEAVARGPALTAWALDQGWIPGAAQPGAAAPTTVRAGDGRPGLVRACTPGTASGVPAAASGAADGASSGPDGAPGAPGAVSGAFGAALSGPGTGSSAADGASGAPGAASSGPGTALSAPDGASSGPDGAVVRVGGAGEAYREDRAVTARALAADALAGDLVARLAMRRAGRALGIAIASATHLCDLDLVTIGGGLSQAGAPLFDPLEEALREHARMRFARRVDVVPAALGQEAGLVGAAALILAGERYWS